MHPAIAQYRTGIAAICQRYGIRRLEVFGSAARASDFDPAHSDADFLVEFAPGVEPGLRSIFGAKADLEALLGRAWIWWSRARCATPMCWPVSTGNARSSFTQKISYIFGSC